MPANATLEFASAVAGANGRWQRFDYRTRRRVRGQSRRCLSGGGRRRRSHKRKAERALRDPSAVVASSVDAHSDAHPAPRRGVPRGVCLDARRGERALRDSADLLEALHMPFDLNIPTSNLTNLPRNAKSNFGTKALIATSSAACCRGCGCWQPRITQDGALLRAKVLIGRGRQGDASQGTFAIQEGCFVYAQVARSDRSAVGRHTGAPLGDDGPRHRGHRARARVRARAGACACACARASA